MGLGGATELIPSDPSVCPREFRGLEEVCATSPNSPPPGRFWRLTCLWHQPSPSGLERVQVLRAPEPS